MSVYGRGEGGRRRKDRRGFEFKIKLGSFSHLSIGVFVDPTLGEGERHRERALMKAGARPTLLLGVECGYENNRDRGWSGKGTNNTSTR